MKLAFWTVTKGAGNIAREYKEKLKEHLKDYEIDVFTLKKYGVENTSQIEDFTANINEKFSPYWTMCIAVQKNAYISKAAQVFINMVSKKFANKIINL